jgi:hypothetical protein
VATDRTIHTTRYAGRATRYLIDVPGDPGAATPARHSVDEGHNVDTSGRDEAPRGGGWQSMEFLAPEDHGLVGSPPDNWVRTHQRVATHRDADEGGNEPMAQQPLLYQRADLYPAVPNYPEDLSTAGLAGAAHGGLRGEGMAEWMSQGRRTVDGRQTPGGVRLGQTYTPPRFYHRQGLHLNRPRLRVIPAPTINVERGGKSPGGYSSAFDSAMPQRTSGARQPVLRRLIQAYGQADSEQVSQDAANRRISDPIGNSGW